MGGGGGNPGCYGASSIVAGALAAVARGVGTVAGEAIAPLANSIAYFPGRVRREMRTNSSSNFVELFIDNLWLTIP